MNWGKRRMDEQKMRLFNQKMEGKKAFAQKCVLTSDIYVNIFQHLSNTLVKKKQKPTGKDIQNTRRRV